MNHKLKYRTELGGWVCTCQRYFDNESQLEQHIKEEKQMSTKKIKRIRRSPLDDSNKKSLILKAKKSPNELIGEFYYHSDVFQSIEGFYEDLPKWLDQAEYLMVEDLLEKWFPDIMKILERK